MFRALKVIGAVEKVQFLNHSSHLVPARIDTGAKTSAVWASNVTVDGNRISFTLFDKNSQYYDGKVIKTRINSVKKIKSTIGEAERRYVVKLPIFINGRKIKASFTLADRSNQSYPVLIGRNVLRGKFVIVIKPTKTMEEVSL
jgi:hypothetical protein